MIALLRRHYGEDVDIAPSPAEILALATASMADISPADARLIEHIILVVMLIQLLTELFNFLFCLLFGHHF